jgi:hypothetical protein
MVRKEYIEELLKPHIGQLLLVAETALPPSQFLAFRKFTLDEFGKDKLGKELDRLFKDNQHKER